MAKSFLVVTCDSCHSHTQFWPPSPILLLEPVQAVSELARRASISAMDLPLTNRSAPVETFFCLYITLMLHLMLV